MGYSPPQPYTTPDGRTVSFPPEFAAQFQGLMPVQPAAPAWQPEPQLAEGGGGMAVQPAPMAAPPAPVVAPKDDAAQEQPEPAQPRPAPAPVKDVAIPRPRTDADLGKIGQAGALNAATGAIDQQAEAGRRAADVEAEGQRQVADAYAQRNIEIDAEQKQRQAAAEEKLQRVNAATADANTAVAAYANHKVSRDVDHPVLAVIGLALGAVGSAMKGSGDNPAMTMLMQQLDKKVQLQMADRDKLKDVAGMKKQAIDQVRQAGDDKIAVYNLAMAGETDKAIRKIEEIKARTSSDAVRANADVMIAGLRERQAALLGQAVNQRLGREDAEKRAAEAAKQHAQQIGLGYSNLGETRRHNMANEALSAQQRDLEELKLTQAGKVAEAKALRERGIGGLPSVVTDRDGKPVIDKDGKPVVDYGYLKNRDGSAFVPNGSDPSIDKLRSKQGASQRLVEILDQVRAEGHEWLSDVGNSDKKQRLQTLWGNATIIAKEALDLGAIQGADMGLIRNYLGTDDPTKFRDATAGMEQARKNIVANANTQLRSHGFNGEWKPADMAALSKPPPTAEDKPAEQAMRWQPQPKTVGRVMQTQSSQQRLAALAPEEAVVKGHIDTIARAVNESPTPEGRKKAAEWLGNIASKAQSQRLRDYATELQQANAERQVNATPVPREPLPTAVR